MVLGALVWLGAFPAPGGVAHPLGGPWRIQDAGQARDFDIALDQLQEAGTGQHVVHFSPLASAQALCDKASEHGAVTGSELRLVLFERGVTRDDWARRILTRAVLAQLQPEANPQSIAAAVGARACRPVGGLSGWWMFDAAGPAGALALAEALREHPGVAQAEPQLARLRQKKLVPNDPLFAQQWHLLNLGQWGGTPGVDLGVTGVWENWRGLGVVIGIVDDGMQGAHPDLAPNFSAALSTNIDGNTFDPNYDTHATPVAGLAAARGNNGLGVCGVAFEAALADIRLIAEWETDEQDRAAMLHRNDAIHIKNNSWGATDGPGALEGPGPLMLEALSQGTSTGRAGRGVVYLFAGGNGRASGEDVNYDGFANARQVIAVGAVDDQGAQASYSEPGACLVVAGPSRGGSSICTGRPGLTTTDLVGSYGRNPGYSCEPADRDYTATFGGTSAATPAVAGVVALMLQANPRLGWRDAIEILMRSAAKVSPGDPDWSANRAGLAHNHKFGGGLANASAAVGLAPHWSNLGPEVTLSQLQTNLNLPIPDNTPAGVSLYFVATNAGFRVEHATLTVSLPHAHYGDLGITLTSPGGTVSRLAEMHPSTGGSYAGWTLNSVRHWGEPALGTWAVRIADLAAGNTGTLNSLRLDLHGSVPVASLAASRIGADTVCRLQVAAPGWRYVLQTSADMAAWADAGPVTVGLDGQALLVLSNTPASRQFYRARLGW